MPKQSQESSRKCGHFLVALAELAAVYGLGRVVDSRVWFNSIQAHSFTGYLPVFSSGNGLKGTFFFLLSSAAPNFKGPVATATVYPPESIGDPLSESTFLWYHVRRRSTQQSAVQWLLWV